MKYEMKPLFRERMQMLMPDAQDFAKFEEISHKSPRNFIRCNTLKISPEELFKRLSEKWKVIQPYPEYKEIMLVDQELNPGELGNAIEHLLGYYYIQEISSMLSVLALNPEPGEIVLDLCASPGSKTTQIAAKMQNTGTLFANDLKIDRIRILAANLERCGVLNSIITRNDAISLCHGIKKANMKVDKILLDAPCSGEGTLRSSPKTFLMWNERMVEHLSRQQKKLLANALKVLKVGGTIVYSTCTHSPEENESVIDFAIKNFPLKIENVSLPLKTRPGMNSWKRESFSPEVNKAHRIYPQDNDSEGFFLCKMTLIGEMEDKYGNNI